MIPMLVKRFENPDEVLHFEKGRFEIVRMGDMTIGQASFAIGPGHDSWVVGDEAYVSLHFTGADAYAST